MLTRTFGFVQYWPSPRERYWYAADLAVCFGLRSAVIEAKG